VGSLGEIVLDGNFAIALPIALLAGLVSFASPCILPLVPGYLGYVGGFAGDGSNVRQDRRRLLTGVSLFILGFTVVFVATGVVFGTAGLLLKSWLDVITPIAGVVIILMGLVFVGQFTFLQRTVKPKFTVATGLAGAPLLGIVFAIGWTPCLGPVLIAVNAIVFDNGDPWRGGLLALAYCLGLGVPFLLVALGVSWFASSVVWLKRNVRVINIIGGSVLVLIGVLMVTGLWRTLISNFGVVISGFVPAL
jgi:cytochrome c-type biogenesis protein